jgi:hypothetical protein
MAYIIAKIISPSKVMGQVLMFDWITACKLTRIVGPD